MVDESLLQDISDIVEQTNPQQMHEFDVSQFIDRVPAVLIEIWKQFGAAIWMDGIFQTFDPRGFLSIIQSLFSKNVLLSNGRATPFLVSSYGLMYVWHEKLGKIEVHFPLCRIILTKHPHRLLERKPSDSTLITYFPTDADDFSSITGYAEDRARLGRLGENEVYGFFPALAFGGGGSPDHVQRVQADIHLDFLASLQPFQLLYFDGRGYSPVEQG